MEQRLASLQESYAQSKKDLRRIDEANSAARFEVLGLKDRIQAFEKSNQSMLQAMNGILKIKLKKENR